MISLCQKCLDSAGNHFASVFILRCSDKLDLCRDQHKFVLKRWVLVKELHQKLCSKIKSTIPIMELCSKAQYQCKNYKRNVQLFKADPSQVAIGLFNIAFSVPFQHSRSTLQQALYQGLPDPEHRVITYRGVSQRKTRKAFFAGRHVLIQYLHMRSLRKQRSNNTGLAKQEHGGFCRKSPYGDMKGADMK